MILKGKTISSGVARGVAHVLDARGILAAAAAVPAHGPPPHEIERLHAAIGRASLELDRLQRQLQGRMTAGDASIFASHAALLHDSKLVGAVERMIHTRGLSAEAALASVISELQESLLQHAVTFVQDKAADVVDIGRRLIRCLTAAPQNDADLPAATVIVAPSLTPSDLVRLAHQGAVAFVTETCGIKSHTAILARGFGLPFLTQVAALGQSVTEGTELLVDASGGRLVLFPTEEESQMVRSILDRERVVLDEAQQTPELPITQDGERLKLLLNISDVIEAKAVRQLQSDGIGLFRTEFLYMDRSWWPTVDENYQGYRQVADVLGTAELNVRLVDFGAEKCPSYADFPISRNPSLGLRGIRLLLQRDDVLMPQVQALARLGREFPLTVVLPMLDTLDTLEDAIERICRFSGASGRGDLPFQLGAMIEVPSAAFLIEDLIPHLDSLSIGLNDLTQFALAVDRDDETVEVFHDPFQPCIVRMVHQVVQVSRKFNKPLTVCGELAGDTALTGMLIGLGVRRFSVSRSNYLDILSIVRRLSLRSLAGWADEVVRCKTSREVRQLVRQHFGEKRDEGQANSVP